MKKYLFLLIVFFIPFYFFSNEKENKIFQDNSFSFNLMSFVQKNTANTGSFSPTEARLLFIMNKYAGSTSNKTTGSFNLTGLLYPGIALIVCGNILIISSIVVLALIGAHALVWKEGWEVGGPVLFGILTFIGVVSLVIGIVFAAVAGYTIYKNKKRANLFMDIDSSDIKIPKTRFGLSFKI